MQILKMVGPKMQDFFLRMSMLKGNCFEKNHVMNHGLSKSHKIVLSKSIFYVKNQQNFFNQSFKNINLGDHFL